MPTIVSHVHPNFVILRAGSIMGQQLGPGGQPFFLDRFPGIMYKIWDIYRDWVMPPPRCAYKDPTYVDIMHEHDSEDWYSEDEYYHYSSTQPQTQSQSQVGDPIGCPDTPPMRIQPLFPYSGQGDAEERGGDNFLEGYDPYSIPDQFSAGWSFESIAEWDRSCRQHEGSLTSADDG
ncbi:hypothetical protein CVT24_006636 [Panaeolus cyanescens]|uniref:Uncharacterized protein n=1 Tax=Panaeolus cyanescens TaxID=181874 RepID=A0A409X185_9AGAR|nr:hypothetical protein CVT24_006636 [Panaeolus cyanescens]